MTWIEISSELGAALWSAYRAGLGGGDAVAVYATYSDPNGEYGQPRMEMEIGVRGGGAYLMRLVTTFDLRWIEDYGGYNSRENEVTHYYLPDGERE